MRLRQRFLTLVNAVCEQLNILSLRRDNPDRHKTLDIVMELMHTAPTSQQLTAMQSDLGFACSSCVKLLDRLQIQSLDETATEDDSLHVVSRLFALAGGPPTAIWTLLELTTSLKRIPCERTRLAKREAELRDWSLPASPILSPPTRSMVSGNACFWLMVRIQRDPPSSRLFPRVIEQRAKSDVNYRLQSWLKGVMVLDMGICKTYAPGEVEIMISIGKSHIQKTRLHCSAAILRASGFCPPLPKLTVTGVYAVSSFPSSRVWRRWPSGQLYELDPDKPDVGEGKRGTESGEHQKTTTSSIPVLPPYVSLCCPTQLTYPKQSLEYGLRRSFPSWEPLYPKYQPPTAEEEADEYLDTTSDDTDIIVLHRYFHKHADKIGKELLSLSKPSDNDPSAIR
ncbi:hypothetical protein R3P38DRAFT_3214187 [Favolaschia claudopus]|uniref:Uncharacterized protein n=1 Tax=Favolaschia claudopus TaxID=2862362 RepID=A0AAW0AAF3_9AGAR